MIQADVIIIGAGAAGLFCAIEAGRRGRSVLLLDHARKPAEKVRISGGGRCNFTNIHAAPDRFLSANPKFCISALRRYDQFKFIKLVEKHGIAYHEKTLGQLFCDGSSQQIIDMLLTEARDAGVKLQLETTVSTIEKTADGFRLDSNLGPMNCRSLVIATGGKSIPKMGATAFGYQVAEQFDLAIEPTRAGLVPLTFEGDIKEKCRELSGSSVFAEARSGKGRFEEALLFTHRGLSGPAVLQISSYWREGEPVQFDLHPDADLFDLLKTARAENPKQNVETFLATLLPKRLAQDLAEEMQVTGRLADQSDKKLRALAGRINRWQVVPSGTEGYRTAEVTLGGVSTDELSSKTMEAKKVPGLYFIGEVVDVTGHLGGYNFQWAWSSAFCAGQYV